MEKAGIKIFETMSAYQARFGNFFYRFEMFPSFDFCGKKAVIKPVFDRKLSVSAFVISIKAGLTEFKIAFENDSFLLFHPAVKSNADTLDVLQQNYAEFFPEALKQALLENLFAECISHFSKKIGEHIEIGNISYEEIFCADKPYLSFLLEMTDDSGEKVYSGLCYLSIPEDMQAIAVLQKLEKYFLPLQHSNESDKTLDIPISLYCAVAETVLAYADFRELSQGDIILFDEFYGKDAKARIYPNWKSMEKDGQFCYKDTGYFSAMMNEKGTEVVEWVTNLASKNQEIPEKELQNSEDSEMAENQEEQNENLEEVASIKDNMAVSVNMDELAVNVHFSLGERMLTLRELKEIKTGYVFGFEKDFLAPVSLIVQGKTVGMGKIVDLNGTVGVQLTELF